VRVPTWASATHKGSLWEPGPSAANSAEVQAANSMLRSAGWLQQAWARGHGSRSCSVCFKIGSTMLQ
jgi:hypothetical protein